MLYCCFTYTYIHILNFSLYKCFTPALLLPYIYILMLDSCFTICSIYIIWVYNRVWRVVEQKLSNYSTLRLY